MDENLSEVTKKKKKCPLSIEENTTGGLLPNLRGEALQSAMCELSGTDNFELSNNIIGNAAVVMGDSAEGMNVIVQALHDFQPTNAIESRLVAQITVLNSCGMNYLSRAEGNKNPNHFQMYVNLATKLLRLSNETLAALDKHRRGGEQRVTVQHVNVENGGQAIVGNVQTGGRDTRGNLRGTP
jgi:hypothetical protein